MAEDFQYKRADSPVEALRAFRSKIKEKHSAYRQRIVGASLYLASLVTRREAIRWGVDTYQKSQVTGPVLEVRNFSRILNEVLKDAYNILKSKGVSIDELPQIIKRKVRREEGKLERELKAIGIKKIADDKGEDKDSERIYYSFRKIIGRLDHSLNGFFEDVGGEIEHIFLEDEEIAKDYKRFEENYVKIGKKKGREPYDTKIETKKAILVARELGTHEKLIRTALEDMKKRRRIN